MTVVVNVRVGTIAGIIVVADGVVAAVVVVVSVGVVVVVGIVAAVLCIGGSIAAIVGSVWLCFGWCPW